MTPYFSRLAQRTRGDAATAPAARVDSAASSWSEQSTEITAPAPVVGERTTRAPEPAESIERAQTPPTRQDTHPLPPSPLVATAVTPPLEPVRTSTASPVVASVENDIASVDATDFSAPVVDARPFVETTSLTLATASQAHPPVAAPVLDTPTATARGESIPTTSAEAEEIAMVPPRAGRTHPGAAKTVPATRARSAMQATTVARPEIFSDAESHESHAPMAHLPAVSATVPSRSQAGSVPASTNDAAPLPLRATRPSNGVEIHIGRVDIDVSAPTPAPRPVAAPPAATPVAPSPARGQAFNARRHYLRGS